MTNTKQNNPADYAQTMPSKPADELATVPSYPADWTTVESIPALHVPCAPATLAHRGRSL